MRVRRLLRLFMLGIMLFTIILPYSRSVLALECPKNMTDLDCQALKYSWENWVPDSASGCGAVDTNIVTSTDFQKNLEAAYGYFLSKKNSDGAPALTKTQAAAIIGNIAHESGGDPQNTQGGYSPDRTTDPQQVSPASGGWGLIQWTPAAKVLGIAKQANITGPIGELQTQLDIVWWHMNNTSPTGQKNMLAGFTQSDLMEAVRYYEETMEAAGIKAYESRFKAAQIALKYSDSTGQGSVISASTGCECSTQNNSTTKGSGIVVLDPGHSGEDRQGKEKDPETGLYIGDSSNPVERKQAWTVAQKIKSMLEAKGYKVLLTKQSESNYVNLRERALIANNANADIAVSIHTSSGRFGSSERAWVTPQKLGGYRVNDNGQKTIFGDAGVATKSQEYSRAIVEARRGAGESGVRENDLNFNEGLGLSGGNLSIEQLLSKVPWVYNETGQTGFDSDAYATGIAFGVMNAIKPAGSVTAQTYKPDPPSSFASRIVSFFNPRAHAQNATPVADGNCSGAASGNAVQTAINYAWPTYTAPPFTTLKPSYATAVKAAQKAGKYVGGGINPGVDCGGFVTRTMQDSGVDPKYGGGGNVVTQHKYIKESGLYKLVAVKSTVDLRPGDIAIAIDEGHTFMYVGPNNTGSNGDGSPAKFTTSIASASYSTTGRSWRAPMAGHENPLRDNYIYRYTGKAV